MRWVTKQRSISRCAAAAQLFQQVLGPGGDPAIARALLLAEGGHEVGGIRRLVEGIGRVDVELQVPLVGIELVDHRRVDPFGEGLGARQVGGDEDHAVGRRQAGADQVDGIAGRRLGDGGVLGLGLIEERQRAAAGPADQDDLLVAELVLAWRSTRPDR